MSLERPFDRDRVALCVGSTPRPSKIYSVNLIYLLNDHNKEVHYENKVFGN